MNEIGDDADYDATLAFANSIVAETAIIFVYSSGVFVFISLYAAFVFFQCKKNADVPAKNKTGWLVFIGVSPFMYGIGAAAYGFVYYKSFFKAFPLVVLSVIAFSSLKIMDLGLDAYETVLIKSIDRNIADDAIREALIEDVNVLRDEAALIGKARNSMYLMGHAMNLVLHEDLTHNIYSDWRDLFGRRHEVSGFGLQIAHIKSQFNAGMERGKESYDPIR